MDKVGWFGAETGWLGPRDPAPFSALTGLVAAEFPSYPPYGGRHAEVMVGPRAGTADIPPGQWRTIAAFPLG